MWQIGQQIDEPSTCRRTTCIQLGSGSREDRRKLGAQILHLLTEFCSKLDE